ncbi:MAG: hypothetical protein ACD_49C00014G0001 [uncultured bacterium (gcode 4)]|uniref:Uncharacterized protein n=1 Tax=uncultured bacterium (gcode 4) TaxID=1234023 RepID=K2AYD9_9BACT|nr:MAG: hypothetical protein ACD_49C00014G0001 [uncultured bacterium (gcode 4)]
MDINQLNLNSEKLEHIIPESYILGKIKTNYQNRFLSTMELKYPSMDEIMNNYMEKSDNNDLSYIRVDMNDWKRIDFWNNQNEEVIYTFWLWGCIATALVIEMEDWTQKVVMTHYNFFWTEIWSVKSVDIFSDIPSEQIKNARFFVIAPGERQKNNDKYEIVTKESYNHHINLYINFAEQKVWKKLKIDKIWYSEDLSDMKNQWTFRIVKWIDNKLKFIVWDYTSYWDVF